MLPRKIRVSRSHAKWFVLCLLAITTLCSCSTTGALNTQAVQLPSTPIAGFEVSVADARAKVEDRKLRVPLMTFPGQNDTVSPPLAESLAGIATRVISCSKTYGKVPLRFKIEVIEGKQSFEANYFTERESVLWDIRMTVYRQDGSTLNVVNGKSVGSRTSLDGSPARIQKMYLLAFEEAVEDALSHLGEPS